MSRRFAGAGLLRRPSARGQAGGGVAGASPTITVAPVLTWTVADGSSPSITPPTYTGDAGTITYDLIRLPSTTVLTGVNLATAQAYVSARATDVGPSWKVTATVTNGSGSAFADSNTVAWNRLVSLPSIVYLGNGSNVTLVGSDVDAMNDQGPSGNDLSAPTASNRPLFVSSGYNGSSDPYIDGDGTSDYLQRTSTSWGGVNPTAYTVLAVSQPANNTTIRTLVQTNGNRILLRVQSSRQYEILATLVSGTGTDRTSSNTLVDGTSQMVNARWDGTNLEIGVNGVFETSVARTGTASSTAGAAMRILSQDGTSSFMGDPVAEIVVCAAAATNAQVSDYAAWAAWKGWI
jgi:hypothetical protein